MKKLILIATVLALSSSFALAAKKPTGSPTVVNTNCGSICGGGIVCVEKQADGSYLTTSAVAGIAAGRAVFLITRIDGSKCWVWK